VTNKGVRTDRHTTCRYITVKKPGDNREYHVIDDPDEKPTPAEHGAVVVPHRPVSAKSRSAGGQSAAAAAASSSSTTASGGVQKRKQTDKHGWEHAGDDNEYERSDSVVTMSSPCRHHVHHQRPGDMIVRGRALAMCLLSRITDVSSCMSSWRCSMVRFSWRPPGQADRWWHASRNPRRLSGRSRS
jgi:hypothetical protein